MTGDASSVHGGVIKEFEPVFGALLEAELSGPGAEGVLVARRGQDFALDFAPVAGVMAVLETEFAQPQALIRPNLFYEFAKHNLV